MKCPICKAKMLVETVYVENEMHDRVEACPNCLGYYSEYSYGVTFTKIGKSEIHSHYKDSNKRIRRYSFLKRKLVARERKRWRKHSKKGGL